MSFQFLVMISPADGVRWSVGASNNEVYDNVVDVTDAEDPLYAIYMCECS